MNFQLYPGFYRPLEEIVWLQQKFRIYLGIHHQRVSFTDELCHFNVNITSYMQEQCTETEEGQGLVTKRALTFYKVVAVVMEPHAIVIKTLLFLNKYDSQLIIFHKY